MPSWTPWPTALESTVRMLRRPGRGSAAAARGAPAAAAAARRRRGARRASMAASNSRGVPGGAGRGSSYLEGSLVCLRTSVPRRRIRHLTVGPTPGSGSGVADLDAAAVDPGREDHGVEDGLDAGGERGIAADDPGRRPTVG